MNRPTVVEGAGRVERRRRLRMQVHWPLRFLQPDALDVETVTQDLSSDGFYCLAKTPFIPGETRACTLRVPTYHPGSMERTLSVECKVRIIRVEVLSEGGLYGVGCRMEDYHFLHHANGHSKP